MRSKASRPRIQRPPFLVILFFLILLMAGIGFGEPGQVLRLATQICLSCMGIG